MLPMGQEDVVVVAVVAVVVASVAYPRIPVSNTICERKLGLFAKLFEQIQTNIYNR